MEIFDKKLLKKIYIKNNIIYIVSGFDFIENKYILKSIGLCTIYTSIENKDLILLKEAKELIDFYFLENIKIKNFIDKYEFIEKNIKNKDELLGFSNLLNKQREIIENEKCLNILKTKDTPYLKEFNDLRKGQRKINKRFYKYFGKNDYEFMIDFFKQINFKPIGYAKHIYKENMKIIEELKKIENL